MRYEGGDSAPHGTESGVVGYSTAVFVDEIGLEAELGSNAPNFI